MRTCFKPSNGLSRSNLQNFLVASGIEALPSARLYEMWFERKWGTTLALVVRMKPEGSLSPAIRNFAITPAMKAIGPR